MKTKILLLAIILFAGISHSYSQIQTTNYEMVGSGSPNQILQVDKLSVSVPQQLIMKPSEIYEDNSFIGIGINTPSEKLHVAGNILADDDIFGTNIQGNIKTLSIQPTTYPNSINISATTGDNRFLLHSNGEYALGDIPENYATQTAMFDVVNTGFYNFAMAIISNENGQYPCNGLFIKTHGVMTMADCPIQVNDYQDNIVFQVNANGNINFTGLLRQNGTEIKPSKWQEQGDDIYFSTGNVGIGNNDPFHTLDVNGDIGFSGNLYNGTELFKTGQFNAIDENNIYFNGNVGIGLDYPLATLDVDGTFKVTSSATIGGTTTFNGQILTNGNWISGNTIVNDGIYIDNDNHVGIGTNSPDSELDVNGKITCGEVEVINLSEWKDFVFDNDYNLRSLQETKDFIDTNHHLPDIPSETEVLENGINLGEMNALLLQKIEELTLYMFELEQEVNKLKNNREE